MRLRRQKLSAAGQPLPSARLATSIVVGIHSASVVAVLSLLFAPPASRSGVARRESGGASDHDEETGDYEGDRTIEFRREERLRCVREEQSDMMMIQVVLTMDTPELVPFEGTQLQRAEDFDASKFHIKELRTKDLHKNLCKKSPYLRVRLDSHKRTSAAESAKANGEIRQSCLGTYDEDYETGEEGGVASVQVGPPLPDPSEAQRGVSAAEQQPCNRSSKRKTRVPGKYRLDSSSWSDLPESYVRYYRRSTSKSKVKPPRVKEKLDPVQTQFFEVPIEAHEVDVLQCDTAATACSGDRIGLGSSKVADSHPFTPSERRATTRPLKQIYHSSSSSQKRHPAPKHKSRVAIDYSECVEVSTDTEPSERPTKTPVTSSSPIWKHNSPPDANTKEILSNGNRSTLDSGRKVKANRTSGSIVNEKKKKPLESESKRAYNAPKGSTVEILPLRWRLNSPEDDVEEILPTEKTRILESKQDTLRSRWKHGTFDPSTGKRTLESNVVNKDRSSENTRKEKKSRTLDGESKQRHSAPNAILPLTWRLPEEQSPLGSQWQETSNRTSETKLKEKTRSPLESRWKLSYHGRDGSTEKILPQKRKHSYSDASTEEIPLTEKKKTPGSKMKDKMNKTSEIKSKEKKAKTTKGELKQGSHVPDAKDGKPARRGRIPIRKLKGGYTSDGLSDVERDADAPGVSHPTFAAEMKYSNVITCFWMGIPADFHTRHMPDHDQFVVLQDSKGLKWEANYLARKKGLSGGWRRFALDHHLEMGDIVVFELVNPRKFLVYITKISGGENATLAIHHPVGETPKKVLKPEASVGTKRVSSFESALFSKRKRVNKDAERKLPSKKPRLAGGDKKDRQGEERESVLAIPAAKPNRVFYPGELKKKQTVVRKETQHYEDRNAQLFFEHSEGEEMLPRFKSLSSTEDDSNAGMDSQELALTSDEEPASVSSLEPQKAGPLSPKLGTRKKLRRVSYFYSTDEDQGNSIST